MPPKETAEEQRDLLQQLKEIAEHCSSPNLKAKAFAEIALLLDMVFRTPLREEFQFRAQMTTEMACQKALQLDNNDNSVLSKTGRIFRHLRKIERSRDLLEKAVSIRPSSTAHHHLGITYKGLATNEKYRQPASLQARVTTWVCRELPQPVSAVPTHVCGKLRLQQRGVLQQSRYQHAWGWWKRPPVTRQECPTHAEEDQITSTQRDALLQS